VIVITKLAYNQDGLGRRQKSIECSYRVVYRPNKCKELNGIKLKGEPFDKLSCKHDSQCGLAIFVYHLILSPGETGSQLQAQAKTAYVFLQFCLVVTCMNLQSHANHDQLEFALQSKT